MRSKLPDILIKINNATRSNCDTLDAVLRATLDIIEEVQKLDSRVKELEAAQKEG